MQMYQRECYEVLFKHFSGEREKLLHQEQESESLRVRMVRNADRRSGSAKRNSFGRSLDFRSCPRWPTVLRNAISWI